MKENILNTQEFYDTLAGDYDTMIRFQERLESEKKVLKRWQDRYHFKNALDAGCGSGLHTLALCALGLSATGVDLSAAMIKKAQENANRFGSGEVSFHQTSFAQLSGHIAERFDALFCLGNSLAHCLTQDELISALKSFHHLCNTGGMSVVQLLNYKKILDEKERFVAINRFSHKEYIRFYDFVDPMLNFNILKIDLEKQTHALQTTTLYPYTLGDLKPALVSCGFVVEAVFGGMDFKEFDEKKSANLIIVARR
jgi:glycine/sarcosine N-methyltransferase